MSGLVLAWWHTGLPRAHSPVSVQSLSLSTERATRSSDSPPQSIRNWSTSCNSRVRQEPQSVTMTGVETNLTVTPTAHAEVKYQGSMLEVWFGPGLEILLDSELEPDSPGKPRLVTTVPQSGEASELLAATLEARATEPKVSCVVVELMKKGRKRKHQGEM